MESGLVEDVIVGDGLGELESLEIDGVVLKDLLEDLEMETGEKDLGDEVFVIQDMKDFIFSSPIDDEGFDWVGMMEIETAAAYPSNDHELVWYEEEMVGTVDFGSLGECLKFYHGIVGEDVTYTSLW